MAKARTTDLQIRGMPVALRERLRARAMRKGLSMSQYVIEQLKSDLERPTINEWLDEVARLPKVDLAAHGLTAAQLVREAREEAGWTDED
jgi:plasmid stability protein